MIELTWLAGPLGLAGLAAAYLLHRGRDPQTSGQEGQADALRLFRAVTPIALALVILTAGLLWLAVSMPTALAVVGGGVAALALAFLGLRTFAFSEAGGDGAGKKAAAQADLHAHLSPTLGFGLATGSLALLMVGWLYFFLIHRSAAFLQTEFVDFGNIVGGLGVGASIVALLIALAGGLFGHSAPAAGGSAVAEAQSRGASAPLSSVAGFGTDLLQSLLCATAAAIVIAGTSGSLSVQRTEGVALPVLIGVVGVLVSALCMGGSRTIRAKNPAGSVRLLSVVGMVAFLVLAFLVATALGLEGRDPYTGRAFLEGGAFWSILSGSLAGILVVFLTESFTSGRLIRRLTEHGRLDGISIVGGLALGMASSVAPLLLVSVVTVVAFYLFGAYGVALAAVGMLGTIGGIASTASMGGGVAAIGRGASVAITGMTGVALFTAFVSATGLWAVGIDMQGPLVLAGVVIGTVVPVALAAIILSALPRVPAGRTGKGAAEPSGADSSGSRALYRVLLPTMLVGILLPALVGFSLGVQALAGVIVAAAFTGGALAFTLANAGSALLSARLGDQLEAPGAEGAALGRVVALFGDACPTAINAFVKLVGISAIVLIPWFVRVL